MFRRVGTSHLCVTDLHNRVLGVVTRRDLLSLKSARALRQSRAAASRQRYALQRSNSTRRRGASAGTTPSNGGSVGGGSGTSPQLVALPQVGSSPSAMRTSSGPSHAMQSPHRAVVTSGTAGGQYTSVAMSSGDSFTDVPLASIAGPASVSPIPPSSQHTPPSSSAGVWPIYAPHTPVSLADNAYPDDMDDDDSAPSSTATKSSSGGAGIELHNISSSSHQSPFDGSVDG